MTEPCDYPSQVSLQLTEACNLRCKMCYFWGESGYFSNAKERKKPASLEIDRLNRLVQELAPARPNYELFGGEPLTYPYFKEVVRMIKEAGSFVQVPTNGTLLAKNAHMLVESGFDSIRVSLDGPREINDAQRGKGSYDKAMAGIEAVYAEKRHGASASPILSVSYTVTPDTYLYIEQFFLHELNLDAMDWVTIQSQNFITEKMGLAYCTMLQNEFGITNSGYWRGFVHAGKGSDIDAVELSRQVTKVKKHFEQLGKNVLLLPPTFSPENLSAYFSMQWNKMTDGYTKCPTPWNSLDVTASGDVAPCHTFYDLVVGNIYDSSFDEIWNGELYRNFRAYMAQHGLMSICPGCCVLYLAGS